MNFSNINNTSVDDTVVATICAVTSMISLFVNITVAVTWLRYKDMRHSFAFLSVSLAFADCGVLAVFLFAVAPFTYMQRHDLAYKWPGHVSLIFWFASLYSMLAISINRYVAIAHTVRYKRFFTNSNTCIIIIATWVMASLHGSLYFIPGCHFVYDPAAYQWYYLDTICFKPMMFLDAVYGILFVLALFLLNLATGIKLHIHNKETSQMFPHQQGNYIEERYKREVRFFLQSLTNSVVFEIFLFSFHVLSNFLEGKFATYFTTGWMWQFSHGTNGFLILIFNKKIRYRWCRKAYNTLNSTPYINIPSNGLLMTQTTKSETDHLNVRSRQIKRRSFSQPILSIHDAELVAFV